MPTALGLLRFLLISLLGFSCTGPALHAQLESIGPLPSPAERNPIFYTPEPPAPGARIDRITPLLFARWDAPVELAPYVGETFYTVLASRMAERRYTPKDRAALDDYRQRRDTLITQLQAALRASTSGSQSAPLDETALVALEASADQLRTDWLEAEFTWELHRPWNANDSFGVPAAEQISREQETLRAAAIYAEGLSPVQRRSLSDFSLQMQLVEKRAADLSLPEVRPGAAVFFLPETARIVLPRGLTPALTEELTDFLSEKMAIQKELALAVIKADAKLSSSRGRIFRDLARRQQPRFDALERKAEALRVRLAAVSPDAKPSLALDVNQARNLRHQLLQHEETLIQRLMTVRDKYFRYYPGAEALQVTTNFSNSTLAGLSANRQMGISAQWLVIESEGRNAQFLEASHRLKQTLEEFKTEHAAVEQELEMARRRLLLETARTLEPNAGSGPLPGQTVMLALKALRDAETEVHLSAYSDYLTATLRPGLSPAQRRLLFQSALVRLQLPLPRGIRRPAFRFNAP